jgi:hypothetical protein
VGLIAPRALALAAFCVFSLYKELLRPPLHRMAMALLRWRSRPLNTSPAR